MLSLKEISSKKNNHYLSLFFKYFLPIFLIGIGMFQTYRESFLIWFQELDETDIPYLIDSVNRQGWSFIRTYAFGVDNWFLSNIIPTKFIFSIFGNNFTTTTLIGTIVFWLTAFLSGFIIYYITKNKIKSLWGTALILMAPQPSLADYGYLVHSCAHNISMFWGLLAFIFYLFWIKHENIFSLIGSIFLLSCASFSDPWLLPTVVLPILCAAIIMFYLNKKTGYKIWGGIIISSIIIIILKSKLFEWLPIHQYAPDISIKLNPLCFPNIIVALSYYFNFIPFCNLADFKYYMATKDIFHIILLLTSVLANTIIICFISYVLLKNTIKNFKTENKINNFLLLFILFSILGIISSNILFNLMYHLSQSRYLINIFYELIIFVCIAPYKNLSLSRKRILKLFTGLYIVSGIISNHEAWSSKKIDTSSAEEYNIISTLQKNDIKYAVSSEVKANLITLLSHGTIKVRPLHYIEDYHGFVLPGEQYHFIPHQNWAFILSDNYIFGEPLCNPFPSCKEAILHQFGKPREIKQADRLTYFIYNSDDALPPHDIIQYKTKPLPFNSEEFSKSHLYYPNKENKFNNLITIEGWDLDNFNEKKHTIRTNNSIASLTIPIISPRTNLHLRIKLASSRPNYRNYQDLDILYNNHIVAQWRLSRNETVDELNIPINTNQKNITLEFHILNPNHIKDKLMGITLSEVQVMDDD